MMFKISLAASDIDAQARDQQPRRSATFDAIIRWPVAKPSHSRTAHPSPVARSWWHPMAKAASFAMDHIVESFAFYALATHPDQSWRWPEYERSQDGTIEVDDRPESCLVLPYRQQAGITESSLGRAATARRTQAPSGIGSGKWLISIPATLWSTLRRASERRRIRAAWESIDDRTLSDIGVSRHEIEGIAGEWRR
jgi:uncharacterized protein YjiS (DUF1127 family)